MQLIASLCRSIAVIGADQLGNHSGALDRIGGVALGNQQAGDKTVATTLAKLQKARLLIDETIFPRICGRRSC